MEQIIIHYNELPETVTHTQEEQLLIFKAWLVANQSFRFEIPENSIPNAKNLFEAILVNKSIQYEFVKPKMFFYQILYGAAFFRYFEQDDHLKIYFENFLNYTNIKSYQEYLRILVELYLQIFSGKFSFNLPENAEFLRVILDSIASDFEKSTDLEGAKQTLPDDDFKLFRNRPLCKRQDGSYYSIHNNFFVDKLFHGLLFDFYCKSSIREKYSSLPKFLQFLGDFSEKHLFYTYLPRCFKGKYVNKISGDKYDNIEYSDYYVRDGKSVFLFEFKNVRMSATVKHSKNYLKIKNGILTKLVLNERGKAKGVTQLFKVIENLVKSPFAFDNFESKKIKNLQIYPIIVYTDDFFEIDGVQTILSEEFDRLISKSDPITSSKHKIHDVTLMHFEDIVDVGSQVTTESVKFRELIQKHLKKRKRVNKDKLLPSLELNQYRSYRIADIGKFKSRDTELLNILKDAIRG